MVASAIDSELTCGTEPVEPATRRDRLAIPALIAAAAISSIGNNLTSIAIPWFVYVTTGSATRTGLVAVAGLLPVAIGGLLSGPIVDRLGFKQASVISDIASGITVAIVPTLYLLDLLEFWHLLVLSFLGALLDSPGWTARSAMIPRLARKVAMPLERANSAIQLSQFGGQTIGPAIAGTLIGFVGAASVLYFDAATFALSALLIGLLVSYPMRQTGEPAGEEPRASVMDDIREGLRYIVHEPFIKALLSISIFANFLFAPMFSVILPIYVKQRFDSATALGLLAAAFGVGSVAGTIFYGVFGERLPRYPFFAGGALFLTTGIWILPLSNSLIVSIAGGLIAGLALGPFNIIATVALQERVPEAMLGRVIGALSMVSLASPLGVLLAGVGIDAIGIRPLMAIIASGVSLIAIVIFIHPDLRKVERLTVGDA
ncbi:MAG TPA: MFS transporter [Thermomicrobiales bacterium]|nr:MFS transporter [Thermomicrobiales bacterium]